MSTNGLVVLPGQELVWQMEQDRTATFKLLSEQTGSSVAVFEELIPTGFGTALHLHHTSNEAMCVLSGAARIRSLEADGLPEWEIYGRAGRLRRDPPWSAGGKALIVWRRRKTALFAKLPFGMRTSDEPLHTNHST
jgi:hypothetical protein